MADLVFPRVCHVCGVRLSRGESCLCLPCIARLPRTNYPRIPMNGVEKRLAGIVRFRRAGAHFFYNRESDVATLLHDVKYRGFPALGRRLGKLIGDELRITGYLDDVDFIVPVPMHFLKKARRGYNQTDHIAAGLSAASGIPVLNAIKAIRGHKTQTSLSMEERLKNTSGIFRVVDPALIAGKHILVVDDVCTTGSTMISIGDCLREQAPATDVSFYTVGCTV